MGQLAHGAALITVRLKMHLSKLIHPLLHHNLLMSHLQTLAFWRRNHNDGPTLSWRTCPRARTCPDVSLARVFTRGIRFAHTHKTYAKHQHRDEGPQTDLPLALHHLQCLTDVPASAPSSSRQRCFLDHSAASLRSFLAAALALAASASRRMSRKHRCLEEEGAEAGTSVKHCK